VSEHPADADADAGADADAMQPHAPPTLLLLRFEHGAVGQHSTTVTLLTNDRSCADQGVLGRRDIEVQVSAGLARLTIIIIIISQAERARPLARSHALPAVAD
jgi:hypothetical protein